MKWHDEARAAWVAANPDLVRRGVALLKPAADLRDDCRQAVEVALLEVPGTVDDVTHREYSKTKPAKRAAAQLAVALRKLAAAVKNEDLDDDLRPSTVDANELVRLAHQCEKAATIPSGKTPRRKTLTKDLSAFWAYNLMLEYAGATEAENAKKGSRFCQLAALLFGEPAADLSNQCKAMIRRRKKSG